MPDTDLDALILEHRNASIEVWINNSVAASRRRRMDAAEAALRARLAPTCGADCPSPDACKRTNHCDVTDTPLATSPDDEATDKLVGHLQSMAEAFRSQGLTMQPEWLDQAVQRLAELRWQVDNWKGCKEQQQARAVKAEARAEAAERALAECRVALKPFADAAEIKLVGDWKDKEHIGQTDVGFHVKFGDLRRAHRALKTKDSA